MTNEQFRMAAGEQKKPVWRRTFRGCRIFVLLVLLAFSVILLWSNYVRVPNFITSIIKEELRRQNFSVEFSRLRLKGFRRLVAEDLRLEAVHWTNGPVAHATEAEIVLDSEELRRGALQVAGVRVKNGEVTLLLQADGQPSRSVVFSQINTEVDFLEGDSLRISQLSADVLGAKTRVWGTLHHLSSMTQNKGRTIQGGWEKQLSDVLRLVRELQFEQSPEIAIGFNVDARNVTRARASIEVRAGETSSKWGKLDALQLTSGVFPLGTNSIRAGFLLEATRFRGPAGGSDRVSIEGETIWSEKMDQLLTNHVSLLSKNIESKWITTPVLSVELTSAQTSPESLVITSVSAAAGSLRVPQVRVETNSFDATFSHALPFPSPAAWLGTALSQTSSHESKSQNLAGEWRFRAADVEASRVRAGSVELSGKLESLPESGLVSASAGFWRELADLKIPWRGSISNAIAQDVVLGSVQMEGNWDYPNLAITNFDAVLYGGNLQGSAAMDVLSREVLLSTQAQFDYTKMATVLDANVQDWLTQFEWERPPFIEALGRLQLPPWTDSWSDAKKVIIPTLQLDGHFTGPGSFRGIPVDNAESHFSFADFVWNLPDLKVTCPDGEILLSFRGNVTNQEFSCLLESRINPAIFRDVFPEQQRDVFDFLKFSVPPPLVGEISGNWDHPEGIHFNGSLQATNFFVKEQLFTDVRVDLSYANSILEFRNVLGHRGVEQITAPYLRLDFPREVMFVTNVVSTIDPWVSMSLVGDDAYDAIDPYRFAKTPLVKVNGDVPLRHVSKANLHFQVSGEDFSFWKFHMASLAGDVWWKADHLNLSNVVANFYNGRAHWSGSFLILKNHAQFSFTGATTNTDLNPLVTDLFGTNKIEGTLSAKLIITSANTGNDNSWNGHGSAALKDGLLWTVPIFGVFSPALDAIAPGLGNSRISSGTADFTITNSVIYTRNMQVRAPAFRLDYKGSVDMEGKLDARVEAEILRDAWIVGKIFSTALWPLAKAFESKVTGHLQQPKTTFRFFPKIVFAPFKALNALGEAMKGKEKMGEVQGANEAAPLPATAAPTPK